MKKIKMTLPTYITLSRFILVPLFVYFFNQQLYNQALITLIITGLTDGLDGLIARKFKMTSRLGSFLDPLADKFLMLVSYLLFWRNEMVPGYLTFLIIGRDLAIMVGILFFIKLLKIKLYYKPTIISKIATFSQIMVLCLSFFNILLQYNFSDQLPVWFHHFSPMVIEFFIFLALITTLISIFQYGYIGYRFYRYGERL